MAMLKETSVNQVEKLLKEKEPDSQPRRQMCNYEGTNYCSLFCMMAPYGLYFSFPSCNKTPSRATKETDLVGVIAGKAWPSHDGGNMQIKRSFMSQEIRKWRALARIGTSLQPSGFPAVDHNSQKHHHQPRTKRSNIQICGG